MKDSKKRSKRAATPEGILKKVSKKHFENVILVLPETTPGNPTLNLTISIKDAPIEFKWNLPKHYIRQLGVSGCEFFITGVNDVASKFTKAPQPNLSFKSVDINTINLNKSKGVIRDQLTRQVHDSMSTVYGFSQGFEYIGNGVILRSNGKSLSLTLQGKRKAGTFFTYCKCILKLESEVTSELFEHLKSFSFDFTDRHGKLIEQCVEKSYVAEFELDGVKTDHAAILELISEQFELQIGHINKKHQKEKVFNSIMSEKPFHEMYPHNEDRKITILCAPTNSGKTYHGTNIIKQALRDSETGQCQMLFPLRVLALQIQQDMEDDGVPCSMITGEEQEVREYSRLDAMTVEIFDTDKEYDTVFLDEGQLAFSKERSSGYLRVLCGANCKHLVIACAPGALKQLEWYLKDILGVSYEIQHLERLTPLRALKKAISIDDIRDGDLVVAFSRKSIHKMADTLSKNGLSVGTLYGALSPSARKAMLSQYRNNGYNALVASDAVGMGISAPAQRVVFAETQKYDGSGTRSLTEEEYRQIAGRAGRFGYAEYGECCVLEGNDPDNLVDIINSTPSSLEIPELLYVTPDKNQLLAAEGMSLSQALYVWQKAIRRNKLYAVSDDSYEELLMKSEWLDKQIESNTITFSEAVRLLFVTFPMRGRASKFQLYKEWVSVASRGKLISPPRINPQDELKNLEDISQELTLMIQLSRIYPSSFISSEQLNSQQTKLGNFIAKLLEKKYALN